MKAAKRARSLAEEAREADLAAGRRMVAGMSWSGLIARGERLVVTARRLTDWQRRVFEERHQLAGRLAKLDAFLRSPAWEALPEDEQCRLCEQHELMFRYLMVLDRRIAAWVRS